MAPKGATKNKIVANKGGVQSPAKKSVAKKVKTTSAKIAKATLKKATKKPAATPTVVKIEPDSVAVEAAAPAAAKTPKVNKKPFKKPAPVRKPSAKKTTLSRSRPSRAKVVTKVSPTPGKGVVGTVLGAAAAFFSDLKRRLSTA